MYFLKTVDIFNSNSISTYKTFVDDTKFVSKYNPKSLMHGNVALEGSYFIEYKGRNQITTIPCIILSNKYSLRNARD